MADFELERRRFCVSFLGDEVRATATAVSELVKT